MATVAVELVRSLVVAVAVAALAAGLGLDGLVQALLLGLALWAAFPVVLLTGSVFHERVPPTPGSHPVAGSRAPSNVCQATSRRRTVIAATATRTAV